MKDHKKIEAGKCGGRLAEHPERTHSGSRSPSLASFMITLATAVARVFAVGQRDIASLSQRIAVGATVEPVAPCSFSGCMTNANS
jgi:hypothetical protein